MALVLWLVLLLLSSSKAGAAIRTIETGHIPPHHGTLDKVQPPHFHLGGRYLSL